MKKLLLTTSILLLAAACNNQQAQLQPAQTQPAPASQSAGQQSQATSTDATATWKTYTNSQHGFEVQLPSDWAVTVNKDGNSTSFNSPENIKADEKFLAHIKSEGTATEGPLGYNIAIWYVDDMVKEAARQGKKLNIIPQLPYSTLQEYVKLNTDFNYSRYASFAGHDAFQGKQGGLFDTDGIYVAKDNHVYYIDSATNNGSGMDLQLNYKILSTFKFTK